MSRLRKSLVIGIGNPMRGDDGLGPAVIERLSYEETSEAFDTLVTHQLLPEHADLVRSYERVIFVDSCVDLPAGEWRLARIAVSPTPVVNAHQLEPPSLLALADVLFEAAPEAWCLRVGVEQLELHHQLSSKVLAAIDCCYPSLVTLTQFQGEAARA